MRNLILSILILCGVWSYSQDTIVTIEDINHLPIKVFKNPTPKEVFKSMDSIYGVNPKKYQFLHLLISIQKERLFKMTKPVLKDERI